MIHIDTDTTTKPTVVRLLVEGQLDLTAAGALGEALTGAARLGRLVELDLTRVDFIDGCGLGLLINATSRARRAGRELAISDASRCVRRLIEITDTAERLPPLLIAAQGSRAQVDERLAHRAFRAARAHAFRF
ncbi:MAG TPA: STAS domain-containing protein [Solirubrobacteraceae bacterium]